MKQLVPLAAAVCIAGATVARAEDPASPGPYEVGFTQHLAIDTTRQTGVFTRFPTGRPVPMMIFYPVDPAEITPTAPPARFRLSMLTPASPVFTSTIAERYGIPRSFHEPRPSADGPFPFVNFSVGWGTTWWDYVVYGTHLASHGYVVAIPVHVNDGIYALAYAASLRPADLTFALDTLLARSADPADLLFGAIDETRIAASGHSLGGYTVMALAAGDDLVCDMAQRPDDRTPAQACIEVVPDPRYRVIAPIDGSNQLLYFEELARVNIPALSLGQDWLSIVATQGVEYGGWQARQHAAFSGHPNYRVNLERSDHMTSFTNFCASLLIERDIGFRSPASARFYWDRLGCCDDRLSPVTLPTAPVCSVPDRLPFSDAHRIVLRYLTAFLDTELRGITGEQRILTPGWALTSETDVQFFPTERRSANAAGEPDDFWYFKEQAASDVERASKQLRLRVADPPDRSDLVPLDEAG